VHDGNTPMPLVIDLHGYSEGAEIHELMSAIGPFGDEAGFVTVTPQGDGVVPRWDTTPGSPDVEFIVDVLDHVGDTLCIDTARVFVTGLSNGAFMTSTLGCELADRIAAIAPVAGIRDIDPCATSRPMPVIAFHGTEDEFVAYDGGFGPAIANLPAPDGSGRTLGELGVMESPAAQGPSIPAIVATWANRNGCAAAHESTVADDVTLIEHDCPAGAETLLYRIEGGGHTWPGSQLTGQIADRLGMTTYSISANELMWEFFAAHPLHG
jgi:polyhydroxybutyrate depolymerase